MTSRQSIFTFFSLLFTQTARNMNVLKTHSTADVPININGSCGGGWVCEHRWTAIANMVHPRSHYELPTRIFNRIRS